MAGRLVIKYQSPVGIMHAKRDYVRRYLQGVFNREGLVDDLDTTHDKKFNIVITSRKLKQSDFDAALAAYKKDLRSNPNPFDWEGCMDKVSRQPGIYSPGGVCAAAERRKMGNPSSIAEWRLNAFNKMKDALASGSTLQLRTMYKVFNISGSDNIKIGNRSTGEIMFRMGSGGKWYWTTQPQMEQLAAQVGIPDYYSKYRNPRNPDELETVFSPESVASKLTLATAVPGAAVAMTAIELAHAVDAGLVDETAAVLMRPVEEVAEAVVGASNPNNRYTVVGYPRMMKGYWGVLDTTTNSIVASRNTKSGAKLEADNMNRREPHISGYTYRRNPSTDADTMYESFHGQPPTETVEVVEELREHGHLATLGTLVELKLQSMAGKDVSIEWTKDNPYLASNEHGTQLYIVGGDQTVDLKAMGMAGDKWEREHMVLGVCHEVTYRTRKGFDKFRLVDYYHNLGEETGVQPMLAYDTVNDKLSIVGGQYAVKPEGIVN